MAGHDLSGNIRENYLAFARMARGRSRPYEILAVEVADDASVQAFLAALPPAKRQPNLLFAAARYLLGRPADIASLRAVVADRGAELAVVIQVRRTQTNEPARCASLLPALMLLPQPLTATPTTTPGTGSPAPIRRHRCCTASPVARCRCRTGCPP